MANTYSQVYLQFIFAVKGHTNVIPKKHNDELQKYITGIITNNGCYLYAIYANPDHVHFFDEKYLIDRFTTYGLKNIKTERVPEHLVLYGSK